MNKRLFWAASAATLFATASLAPIASAQSKVRCAGINSCKGTSACKTSLSSCKGKNSCKGLGWNEMSSEECTSKGGKIL